VTRSCNVTPVWHSTTPCPTRQATTRCACGTPPTERYDQWPVDILRYNTVWVLAGSRIKMLTRQHNRNYSTQFVLVLGCPILAYSMLYKKRQWRSSWPWSNRKIASCWIFLNLISSTRHWYGWLTPSTQPCCRVQTFQYRVDPVAVASANKDPLWLLRDVAVPAQPAGIRKVQARIPQAHAAAGGSSQTLLKWCASAFLRIALELKGRAVAHVKGPLNHWVLFCMIRRQSLRYRVISWYPTLYISTRDWHNWSVFGLKAALPSSGVTLLKSWSA